MTTCDQVRPLLHAMLEGGLCEREQLVCHAHLAQCAECRETLELERELTDRLRHQPVVAIVPPKLGMGRVRLATAALAAILLAAWAVQVWSSTTWSSSGRVASTMMSCMLGASLEWLPSSERELDDANHIALPSGARTSIDLVDVGSIEATGPVAFEIDRTTNGWKLTLLLGALEVDVAGGSGLVFAWAAGTTRLTAGAWSLGEAGAKRTEQDSTSQLLRQANATFQKGGDMATAERQFQAVLAREDCTPYQRRVSLYLLWITQQRLQKFDEALTNIDTWLKENPSDSSAAGALFHKGLILAKHRGPTAGIAIWRALIAAHPGDEAAKSARAKIAQYEARGEQRKAPRTDDIESWARECATEIPWSLDGEDAERISQQQNRPLLVYVRCTYRNAAFLAANKSVAATSVALRDAGYAKDLLFRAGALADSRVSATVRSQFAPLLISYDFHSHGKGLADANWKRLGRNLSADTFDAEVGATAAGSLTRSKAGSFLQAVVQPVHQIGDEFRLTAKAKTRGGSASIRVYWSARGDDQIHGRSDSIDSDAWTELSYVFTPAKQLINVLVMPTMTGVGQVWFDDLELVQYRDEQPVSENLLRNGSCGSDGVGVDPLRAFGLRAKDVVTPALLVVDGGKVTHQLHRVGAISAEHVNDWLREAAAVAGPAKPRASALQDGWLKLASADWRGAVEALAPIAAQASHPARDEAGFLRGLALHRLGRHREAAEQWRAVAAATPHGRRAAACLLPSGPYLPQAISLRAWGAKPATDSSEVADGQPFDVQQSIAILLELQQSNGVFVDHLARSHAGTLKTPWSVAYTAIAGDALRSWREGVDAKLQQRIDAVLPNTATFLEAAARSAPRRTDTFNDPYAIDYAIAIGATATAQRFVDRINESQQKDGCWTVYGPQRPTSFNTAQNLLGLLHARDAGLKVDADVIDKATKFLASMRLKNGRFSYAPLPGFKWMTTPVGGVAREPLCEHALLAAGAGSTEQLDAALDRFVALHEALRKPTKHYNGDFNKTGHGSYFFYYACKNAVDAAEHTDPERRARVHKAVREAVLSSREADGSFMDHALYGRTYGTAMALSILGQVARER